MTVDNPSGVPEAAAELIALLADEGVTHFFINPGTDSAPIQEALAAARAAGTPSVAAKMIVQAQTRISRLRRSDTADIEHSSTLHAKGPAATWRPGSRVDCKLVNELQRSQVRHESGQSVEPPKRREKLCAPAPQESEIAFRGRRTSKRQIRFVIRRGFSTRSASVNWSPL